MSEEDWWSRWFRRKRAPLFRGWFPEDFEDIFRKMEELVEKEFNDLSEKAPKELVREGKLSDGSKVRELGPFVYGYSVKIGSNGKPKIREFGNIKPGTNAGRPRFNVQKEREPLVDIMETENEIKVIAELPGVEKKDIDLYVTEKSLVISVETPRRKYRKEMELPSNIETKNGSSTYKNGVLEVTLQKRKEEKSEGETINID